ncbi:cGMP-dependent protein kinase 1-like [Astyanax mexicanus]|uniref:cGMP-dependent protein kinase 1-like n=1 Tax=Astyanax mexicanus TaxID=7994 RepID=A0A8T2LBJ3_ASTMX|nr:cGMP-dependent protein kinase 1-like [Astyanax mexicanus]
MEEDLARLLLLKEERIREMELRLAEKEEEIAELKRKLHKCQSVLPSAPLMGPRTRRAQGISAEPQPFTSFQQLTSEALRKHAKSDRQPGNLLLLSGAKCLGMRDPAAALSGNLSSPPAMCEQLWSSRGRFCSLRVPALLPQAC